MDLERDLRNDPDDPELPLVYADALGNERGEYIVLANLAAPTFEQRRRERELRRAAEQSIWDATKRDAHNGLARLTWRTGFVDRIDVVDLGADAVRRLRVLLARPELLRLRAVDLRPAWHARLRDEVDVAALVELLGDLPIRWLGIGCRVEPLDFVALQVCKRRFPRLTGLALAGDNLDASKIPHVTDLELAPGYPHEVQHALELLPLERLVIHYSDGYHLDHLTHIFDGETQLRHFGITGGDDGFNDRFAQRLAESKLLPRLASVGFTVHRNEQSNKWLVEHKSQFAHVKFFTAPQWEGGSVSAWHELGHLYEALGRTEDALVEFDALVTVSDDATYWADVGMQLGTPKRYEEALAAHDHALALDDKCKRSWSGKACVLEDLERFADAAIAWEAGLAAGLHDIHTLTHYAWTLMRLERNDEALPFLDEVLFQDPKHEWALENRRKLRSTVAKAKRAIKKLFAR